MSTTTLEQQLVDAFTAARAGTVENPDLFARVRLSLEDARERRRFRWRLALSIAAFVAATTALSFALSDYDNRRFVMPWWVIELITDIVLVALAVALGPFIKRFGRSYAADVFRAQPRTGKSYLVLTDVAYYLIFTSFVLFTVTFVEPSNWVGSTGAQLKHEVARVAGILLIMGVLHAANVVALPIIGQLLSNNHRAADTPPPSTATGVPSGTWVLKIEPAPGNDTIDPPQ